MFDDESFLKKYQNHLVASDLFANRKLLKSFEPAKDSMEKKGAGELERKDSMKKEAEKAKKPSRGGETIRT